MNDPEPHQPSRIDQINTRWTLIQRAHGAAPASIAEARNELVLRYAGAIRKYVGAITRNEEDSDELAQDVVVRLLKGDFAGADPARGRFRDFLKVAIRNMARNFWDKKNRRAAADYDLEQHDDVAAEEPAWVDAWSNHTLQSVWGRLSELEQQSRGGHWYSALKLRTEFPDDSSEQLADKLSQQLGKPVRADAFRQTIRRARVRFAELLVEVIADGVNQPDGDRIEDELIALGLLEHIRGVLPDNWKAAMFSD